MAVADLYGLSPDAWGGFSGKSFVVTGAGSGYGQCIACVLAQAGCVVHLVGRNVQYFDVLSYDGLCERAREHDLPVTDIPHIHYVSPDGVLSTIPTTFQAVFSAHVIEHQPFLLSHLIQVSRPVVFTFRPSQISVIVSITSMRQRQLQIYCPHSRNGFQRDNR